MQWGSDCVGKQSYWKWQTNHTFRELANWIYLFKTHMCIPTSTGILEVHFSFILSCLQVTKNFNAMKDMAFSPQGQLPQESWCYFATFWAFTVIWLKWEADIFLTRILPWSWERLGNAESCRDGYSEMLKWRQRWSRGVGLGASSSSFCSGFVPHGDGAGSSRRPDQKDFIVVRHVLDPIYF